MTHIETEAAGYHRVVDEHITVAVTGRRADPDAIGGSVALVVVTMPAYVADSLAHVINRGRQFSDARAAEDTIGCERELAAALTEAATHGGHRCPSMRLRLVRR